MTDVSSTPSPFDLQPPPSALKAPWWSTWEDVLDVCYAPFEVFRRRRDGKYLGSALVLAAISVVIALLSAQVMEAVADIEFTKRMAEAAASGQKLTPEQVAGARAFAAKFSSIGPYITPVFLMIGVWIGGLALWLLTLMLGGKITFGQSSMIALLSSVPETLERVLVGVQGLLLDTGTIVHKYSFSTNAARFLAADTDAWLMKAAALADPFVIWGSALLGIGVYVLGNLEKEKAAVVAVLNTLIFAALFR